MRRMSMAVGERLGRGRPVGYLPPRWEGLVHAVASPLLARTTWPQVRHDLAVRSMDVEAADFVVAIASRA